VGLEATSEVTAGPHDVLEKAVQPHAEPSGERAVRLGAAPRDPGPESLARFTRKAAETADEDAAKTRVGRWVRQDVRLVPLGILVDEDPVALDLPEGEVAGQDGRVSQ